MSTIRINNPPIQPIPHLARLPYPKLDMVPILSDSASKTIHSYMSQVLDIYHFYTSSYLHLRPHLPGFKRLHHQLGQDHCEQVQDWVRFLHINHMEVCMENIFLGNMHVHYFKQMEEERKQQKDMLEFLMKVTEDAINKEESLFRALVNEETTFVHLRDQEMLGIRLGSLEFCKEKLEEVKGNNLGLQEVDIMVEELEVRGTGAEKEVE